MTLRPLVTLKDDRDEKTYVSRTDLGMKPGKPLVFLTEGGFNTLISRSYKVEAVEFQRWVNHTVLPAIRKDGMYVLDEESDGREWP